VAVASADPQPDRSISPGWPCRADPPTSERRRAASHLGSGEGPARGTSAQQPDAGRLRPWPPLASRSAPAVLTASAGRLAQPAAPEHSRRFPVLASPVVLIRAASAIPGPFAGFGTAARAGGWEGGPSPAGALRRARRTRLQRRHQRL